MKTKIIALLLLYIPIVTIGQTPIVQKLIDGKPCDSCLVKSFIYTSNILPHVFIGSYINTNRFWEEIDEFKESVQKIEDKIALNKQHESLTYIISDSIFNIVYLTELDRKSDFLNTKNYDYNEVEIQVEKNNQIIMNWKILDHLPSVDGYKINRYKYDYVNKKDTFDSYTTTHATGDIKLAYDDLVIITLRNINNKEIIWKHFITRKIGKPNNIDYYQVSINTTQFKESLQSFLNDPISSDYIRMNDTINSFYLQRNNIGVLIFKALEVGEELEYKLGKNLPWKTIKNDGESAFQSTYIILDNEDIPPGTTKTLFLRYKNQPETEIPITIRGTEDITQTSLFKILAGFMLASLLFGIWHYFKQKRTKKRLEELNQKNKNIETQLSLLSGQLNPHFLFNALNAIQGTIMNEEFDTANTYISAVANFMRRVMDDGIKEFISLQEELNLEEEYLKIEHKRKKFTYNIKISPSLNPLEIEFPPLLLQPILENSIRHGLSSTITNPHIEIEIYKDKKNLVVKIMDNGTYWDVTKFIEGQGFSLTQKRISIYNDKLDAMKILMGTDYSEGTITTFTFINWLS